MADRPTTAPPDAEVTGRPRVRTGAKALVTASGRALLVEERHADGSPFWTLPGGGVADDEPLAAGLRREVAEELGCRSLVGDAVARFPYAHSTLRDTVSVYTVFDCSLLTEPAPNPAEGVVGHRWVRPSDPPAPTLPQVRSVLRGLGNP